MADSAEFPTDPLDLTAVRTSGPGALWMADIVPLFHRDSSTPPGRYGFVLVMAESIRLQADLLTNPIADDAARNIAQSVRAVIQTMGVAPAELVVRGRALATDVARALAMPALVVSGVDTFADLSDSVSAAFAADALVLRQAMDGEMIPHAPTAVAPCWTSWGVSLSLVAEWFRAVAALFRATMARGFGAGDGTVFLLDTPGRGQALATLSPNPNGSGQLDTITVYSEPEDWDAIVQAAKTDPLTAAVRHPVMNLSFVPPDDMETETLREIHAHQWEIATPTAYPWVWFLNAIGGGVSTDYLRTITAQLGALARVLDAPSAAAGPLDLDLALHTVDRHTGIDVHSLSA